MKKPSKKAAVAQAVIGQKKGSEGVPQKVTSMRAGEVIGTDLETFTVKAPCDVKKGGAWFCESHRVVLESELARGQHTADLQPHKLAWFCQMHGFEQP